MGNGKVSVGRQSSLVTAAKDQGRNQVSKGYPAVTQFAQVPSSAGDNSNGLPHQLRQGVETLSGISMADTSVHYNSSAPAQIGALAYAKGNQIHLGPGQEQHLPHETWHVVQQKQGRVKPTLQAKGLSINNDPTLEREADVMGQQAAQLKIKEPVKLVTEPVPTATDVLQRKIGFEFQAVNSVVLINVEPGKHDLGESKSKEFTVTSDGGAKAVESGRKTLWPELELVTKAVEETREGREKLEQIMIEITRFSNSIQNGKYIAETAEDIISWKYPAAKKEDLNAVNEIFEAEVTELDEKSESRETRRERKLEERKVPKYYVVENKINFHPQATVGVKFEKVIDLMGYLTNAPVKEGGVEMPETEAKSAGVGESIVADTGGASQKETKDIKREPGQRVLKPDDAVKIVGWGSGRTSYGRFRYKPFKYAWMAALNKVNPLLPSKVKALAAIFYGLAENRNEKYKEEIANPHYVKDMMPFMLRTGFMPFFKNLNEDEKKALKNIDWKGALDGKLIMPPSDDAKSDFRKTGKIPTVKEVFDALIANEPTVQAEDKREVDVQIDLKGEIVNVQIIALRNNEEAKDHLEEAKDYLEEEEVAGHGDIENLTELEVEEGEEEEGRNNIGISDTETATTGPERRRGAIIELRNLGNKVPPEKLTEFALAVHDLIRLINRTPPPIPPPPPPPPADD